MLRILTNNFGLPKPKNPGLSTVPQPSEKLGIFPLHLPMNLSEMLPDQPVIDVKELKGLWIPNIILFNDKLTHMEKILLSFIYALDGKKRHCYASNKYLAELMGVSQRTISNSIVDLKKKKFIHKISWNGKIRVMRVSFDMEFKEL